MWTFQMNGINIWLVMGTENYIFWKRRSAAFRKYIHVAFWTHLESDIHNISLIFLNFALGSWAINRGRITGPIHIWGMEIKKTVSQSKQQLLFRTLRFPGRLYFKILCDQVTQVECFIAVWDHHVKTSTCPHATAPLGALWGGTWRYHRKIRCLR